MSRLFTDAIVSSKGFSLFLGFLTVSLSYELTSLALDFTAARHESYHSVQ